MSVGGPQYPLLTRLSAAVSRLSPRTDSQLCLFHHKVDDLIAKRKESATRPLSETGVESGNARSMIQDRGPIVMKELYEEIPHEGFDAVVLTEAVRRLEKETRGGGEVTSDDKGVRQL